MVMRRRTCADGYTVAQAWLLRVAWLEDKQCLFSSKDQEAIYSQCLQWEKQRVWRVRLKRKSLSHTQQLEEWRPYVVAL